MIENQTIVLNRFGGGINTRDDELYLDADETAYCANVDLQLKTGLRKVKGFERRFEELGLDINCQEVFNYSDYEDVYRWIGISYPYILAINPEDGNYLVVYSSWVNSGVPYGFECDGRIMLVDGENNPILLNKTTATAIVWPPVYVAANNDVANLGTSYMGIAANPATLGVDIWYPAFGAWHKNRAMLGGDRLAPRRMYSSLAGNPADFSNNTVANSNISFFVDIETARPLTSLKVLNNQNLIIYCDREILTMTGSNPPRTTTTPDPFVINIVNKAVGALSNKLVVQKGDNDHYFVASQGRFYTLQSTDNFLDAKPLGLTDKIHDAFDGLTDEALKRGRLVNNELRGEVQFWFPSSNSKFFPDQCYTLQYDTPDAAWGLLNQFGADFRLQGALIDRRDASELLLSDGSVFLKMYSGESYDGEAIRMAYQLPTLDFGMPSNYKRVAKVTIYASTQSGLDVRFNHLWDNQLEGSYRVTFPEANIGLFDSEDSLFDEALFTSDVGIPFQAQFFEILNPEGRIMKSRIECTDLDTDLLINAIVIDWERMSQ